MTMLSKNKAKSVLRFQLVLDAENVVISTTPKGKIRANITGLDFSQIKSIVETIEVAGPEACAYLKNLVGELQ